ncbi:MAG: Crp/Fnr family transcriptional regulator [Paracoccaceae bacterium]
MLSSTALQKHFPHQKSALRFKAVRFASEMKRLTLEPNKFIFRKGDAANGVYLVISGQVGIFLPSNATKEPDFLVRENELFGEMGVVSDQSRMANAATVTDCDLLFVSRDEFDKMLDDSHIVVKGILRILSERLRTAQMPKK